MAVEWDDHAAETFRLNFPDVLLYHGDIATLSVDEALRLSGVKPGELDLLDGSPPCQGFSVSGKRQMDDARNSLFREYCRLLTGLSPRAFIMENVAGMMKGKMKLITAEVFRELQACGYRVKAQLMDSQYFEVPQSRPRMIFVGVRKDLPVEPAFPHPSRRMISCREALHGIDHEEMAPPLSPRQQEVWRQLKPGEAGYRRDDGQKTNFSHQKLHPLRPSFVMVRSCLYGGYSRLWHWAEPRSLSLGELKRIGAFPPEFRFPGTYEQAHNLMGNSVPPRFMQAIAAHVRQAILEA